MSNPSRHPRPSSTPSISWVGVMRRGLGWGLLGFGGLTLLTVLAALKPADGEIGCLVATLVLIVAPGYLLLRSGRRAGVDRLRQEQLIGLCRSMRWVTVSDLCRELHLPEAQAKEFVRQAVARQVVDLMYLPDEERYLSRADFEGMRAIPAGHCPTCDAPHPPRKVLPGERCTCEYCDQSLLPEGSALSA